MMTVYGLTKIQVLYDLKSKTELAKYMLDNIINHNLRLLIFCGSIKQAETLCDYTYHSKTTDEHLNMFVNKKINRLACVQALNEGHNIPKVDAALIVQLNSNDKDLIQRIGRVIRLRDGHKANIWILSTIDTQDEKWVDKALSNFNNIVYINEKNIKNT